MRHHLGMRSSILLGILISLFLIGCNKPGVTVTGANGEKVTTDANGHVEVTDKDGKKVTYDADKNGNIDVKGDNGASMHVDKGGMTVTDEKGNTSSVGAGEVTEATMSFPIYPGSTPIEHGDSTINADGQTTYLSNRETADSPEKVIEFYKDKVKEAQTTTSGKLSMIQGKTEDGRTVAITAYDQDGKIKISVSVVKKN